MKVFICNNAVQLGQEAATLAASLLREAILKNGEARMIVSTGSSQFETFQALINEDISWEKVEVFHLDEYIGLPVTHMASFRKYLYERFIDHVNVRKFHPVATEGDLKMNIHLLSDAIMRKPVDLGLIGIGVNSHIAFNDPPADFDTHDPYIIVKLNDQCKLQQVNEGWFKTKEEVPDEAVSMSVWQILQCRSIISCVPHSVKADAVKKTFMSPKSNMVPSSILKRHNDFNLFLDNDSATGIMTF